jgi:hypothetical protein
MEAKAVLCIFLSVGILLGSNVAAYVPIHRDFSSADEDFSALTSFLEDSKEMSEDLLSISYDANVSILFSDLIKINYDKDKQVQSLVLSEELLEKLNFSLTILDDIDDFIQSKQILSEILIPLKDIGITTALLCKIHVEVIDGFVFLHQHILSNTSNKEQGMQNFTLIHQYLAKMDEYIATLREKLPLLSDFFSVTYYQHILEKFSLLVIRYEEYLSRLLNFLIVDEPLLVLYASSNLVYVSQDIVFSGFFIQPSGAVSNHTISLFEDTIWRNSTQTNDFGRFSFIVDTEMMQADQYSFFAKTSFQEDQHVSNNVFIDMELMPTKISMQSSKRHIQPNESFMISGRLLTIFNQPLEEDVTVIRSNISVKLKTDSRGYFYCIFSNFSKYDSYEITAFFAATQMYRSSFSNLTVFVNEPTSLFLYAQTNKIKADDSFYLFGYLLDTSNDVGIGGKFVSLFVNGVRISQTTTDDQGNYSFVFSTANSSSDVFVFQSRFSGDSMWRPAASAVVEVGFFVSFFQQNYFIFLGLGILCIGFFVFFYLLRGDKDKVARVQNQNKKRYNEKNKKPVLMYNKGSSMNKSKSFSSLSHKNKIVSIYHQLLFFFISQGLDIDDSFTHRDIQRKLESFHLPSVLVDEITSSFERAHYSLQPIRKEDVQRFSRKVKSLQSLFLEGLQR